jgi:thiol-disulfide isomerase/thioredoxin
MKTIFKYFFFLFIVNTVNSQTSPQKDTLKNFSKIKYEEIYKNINLKLNRSLLGVEVPYFVVKDIDGKVFDSSKTKRLVIYSFWFSACAACLGEVEIINELHNKFNEQVDFISITFETKNDIEKYNINHPSVSRQLSLSKDFINNLNINIGYPTILLVFDGKVVKYQITGISSKESIDSKIFMFGTYYKFRSAIEQLLIQL